MNRPLLIRVTPRRFRIRVWYHSYRNRRNEGKWLPLYRQATLSFSRTARMDLVPGDSLSDSIAFTGLYEYDLSRRVAELGRKGGMMVDVGANLEPVINFIPLFALG